MIFPIVNLALGISQTDQIRDSNSELIQVIGKKLGEIDFNQVVINHIKGGLDDHPWLLAEMRERCQSFNLEDLPRDLIRAPIAEFYRFFTSLSLDSETINILLAEIQKLIIYWCLENIEILEPYSPWGGSKEVTTKPIISLDSFSRYQQKYPTFQEFLTSCRTRVDEHLERCLALFPKLPKLPNYTDSFSEIEAQLQEISTTYKEFERTKEEVRGFLAEFYVATALRLLELDKLDNEKRNIAHKLTKNSEKISNTLRVFEKKEKDIELARSYLHTQEASLQRFIQMITVLALSYISSLTAFDIAYENYIGTWQELVMAFEDEKVLMIKLHDLIDNITHRAEELLM